MAWVANAWRRTLRPSRQTKRSYCVIDPMCLLFRSSCQCTAPPNALLSPSFPVSKDDVEGTLNNNKEVLISTLRVDPFLITATRSAFMASTSLPVTCGYGALKADLLRPVRPSTQIFFSAFYLLCRAMPKKPEGWTKLQNTDVDAILHGEFSDHVHKVDPAFGGYHTVRQWVSNRAGKIIEDETVFGPVSEDRKKALKDAIVIKFRNYYNNNLKKKAGVGASTV
ncbi:hypothetical protein K488DRAFT_75159, partial [Vararia minispora EC-137]